MPPFLIFAAALGSLVMPLDAEIKKRLLDAGSCGVEPCTSAGGESAVEHLSEDIRSFQAAVLTAMP